MALQSFYQSGLARASDMVEQTGQSISAGTIIYASQSTTNPKRERGTLISIDDCPKPYKYLIENGRDNTSVTGGWQQFGGCYPDSAMTDDGWAHTFAPDANYDEGDYQVFPVHSDVSHIPNGHNSKNKIDFTNVNTISITFHTDNFLNKIPEGWAPEYRFTIFKNIYKGPGGDDTQSYQDSCFWDAGTDVQILYSWDRNSSMVLNDTTITINLNRALSESRYFCIAGTAWGGDNRKIYPLIKEIKLSY